MLCHLIDQSLCQQDWDKVVSLRHKLQAIIDSELYGYAIRSRCEELQEVQTGTIYHANREMKRGKTGVIAQLMINGRVEEDVNLIGETIKKYYEALYRGHHRTVPGTSSVQNTGQTFQPNWDYLEMFTEKLPSLQVVDSEKLSAEITLEEVTEAIKSAKHGSAPGPNGLSYELYKSTCTMIAPILRQVFNESIRTGVLPPSYSCAVTRLIP